MSTCKLVVVDYAHGYALQWIVDDDDGAYVGQSADMSEEVSRKSRDDRETYLAEQAAKSSKAEAEIVGGIYVWESYRAADAVRKAAMLAIKTDAAEMPEWATKALAAGWKPPKGWKP